MQQSGNANRAAYMHENYLKNREHRLLKAKERYANRDTVRPAFPVIFMAKELSLVEPQYFDWNDYKKGVIAPEELTTYHTNWTKQKKNGSTATVSN